MSLLLAVTLLVPQVPTAPVIHLPVLAQEPVAVQGGVQRRQKLFPDPAADMIITAAEGDASWTMMDLVRDYGRLTNQSIQADRETRSSLESCSTGLGRSVSIPKAKVQSFFEGLLVENRFALEIVHADQPRLLRVSSFSTRSDSALRARARFVPSGEVAAWASHPAMVITTTLHLPNVDVRQLSNSVRMLVTDPNTQAILSVGNTNSIMLTGPAANVADWAEIMLLADAYSVNEAEEPKHQPEYHRFALDHADARVVAPMIEELVASARVSGPVQQQGAFPADQTPKARVLADSRTNALVVMCTPSDLPKVTELVKLFDVKSE